MKHLFILPLYFLSFSSLFSQVSIGKSKSPINLYVSDYDKEVFDKLKLTTTYFVVPDDLKLSVSEVEKVISEVWVFNEIKFISEDEYINNKNKYHITSNSLIYLINNSYVKKEQHTGKVKGERIVYKLVLFDFELNKKSEISSNIIAEIFFTPNIRFRRDFVHAAGAMNPLVLKFMNYDKLNAKNPEKPGFYNFDLGYIKNYVQTLNDKLVKSENLKIRDGIENIEKLSDLKNQVLYAPEWILKKYEPTKAVLKEIISAEKQFKDYKYEYMVISNAQLNNKILNKENIYYLMHTQFNEVKIISIINSLTGEIIYLSEENSYNVKPGDIKSISKLIK